MSAQESWPLLADSPDALRAVINCLESLRDQQSFRLVCKAARAAVDSTVTSLHLEFEPEEGENDSPQFNEEEEEDAYYVERLHESMAFKNFPGVGDNWPDATTVSIENCGFSALTFQLLNNASSRWRNIESLILNNCRFGKRDHSTTLSALTVDQCWHNLQILEITNAGLTSVDLEIIAKMQAPKLAELDLSDNKLTSLLNLTTDAAWPLLTALTLCRNTALEISSFESLNRLISAFPKLDDLDVSGVPLTVQELATLGQAPFQSLTWLTLAHCSLTDAKLKAFAPSEYEAPNVLEVAEDKESYSSLDRIENHLRGFRYVESLDLSGNDLQTSAGIKYLCASAPYLPNLTSLDLSSNNQLRGDALAGLAHSFWPRLEVFEASNMVLSTVGIAGLTSARLPQLRSLILRNSIMSWAAVDQLSSGQWQNLRKLDLGGHNGVHLRRAGPSLSTAHWPRLKTLILRKSPVRIKTMNRKGLLLLLDTWPNLKVRCEG
jgi:Leucine-rich repeat (LRR) protein